MRRALLGAGALALLAPLAPAARAQAPSAPAATMAYPTPSRPDTSAVARPAPAAPRREPFEDRGPAYDPTLPPKGIPDGWVLIDTDVLVRASRVREGLSLKGSFTSPSDNWINGTVPYEFDANVSPANRAQAWLAMGLWQGIGNGNQIHFVARSSESDYIHIQNSTGNNSPVGVQGGEQIVNILNWDNVYIIAHELNHALGRWHEQARADRDGYVTINYGWICQNCCSGSSCDHNFDIRSQGGDYGPYDFDSVMHYPACGFSIGMNCPTDGTATITVNQPWTAYWQSRIGQRDHLSYLDQLTTSFMYAAWDWRFVDPGRAGRTPNGGFYEPWGSFTASSGGVPLGGTLWVEPGTYGAVGTWGSAMTVRAPNGTVTLQ